MKQIKFLFSLVLVTLLFTCCETNESDDDTDTSQNDITFAENFGSQVSRDFVGQVVDEDDVALQNVTIKIGSSTVQTDVNGFFIINGASVNERFAYITAKKAGYIDGSRSMVPTNGKNNLKIMLLHNTPLQTIQSGVASEVAINSETKVVFDGAFQNENGTAYNGPVQVYLFHLTPSDENVENLMPGMLYAQTKNNQEAFLETYGMLNVELKGSAGQKLEIASGHKAEINLSIDANQITTAPNTIPLWHFDEEKGYWKEDGVATKVGNKYVGNVSHFSWWNCDVFFSTANLNVTVVDVSGNPISGVEVSLNYQGSPYPATSITNNNGQIAGPIPTNMPLSLNIHDICGNIIYTSQIGPFTQDTDLAQIQLQGSNVQATKISGSIVKCDNTIVTNGYVLLRQGNKTFASVLNQGNYSFRTLSCSNSNNFSIEGFDFDNLQTTGELSYNFEFPETRVNALKACNAITEYITFSINGENTIVTNNLKSQVFLGIPTYGNNIFANQMTIYANYGTVPGGGATQIPGVAIECGSSIPGDYTTSNSSVRISVNGSPNSYFFVNGISNISNYHFRINKFGIIGDYIDVTFSGTLTEQQNTYIVSGSAHVRRDF